MAEADTTQASAANEHPEHDPEHDHEAPAERLGPPDLMAWGAAFVGGAVGLSVALALFVAAQA